MYRVSVVNGDPAPHPDDMPDPPGELTSTDRITELDQGGMATGPVAFFTEDDPDEDECTEDCDPPGPDVCIGPVCFPSGIGDGFVPTYWFQSETQ